VRLSAHVAVVLALAHEIEDANQRGVAQDRADAARVIQLLDLTPLTPEIQGQSSAYAGRGASQHRAIRMGSDRLSSELVR
jgi:hypothetical protein